MALRPEKAELFIGLAARMGVDTRSMVSSITKLLKEYDYEVHEIKVTSAVLELDDYKDISDKNTHDRYDKLITACDDIRGRTKMADIMASFAVSRISQIRNSSPQHGKKNTKTAYIINQLKRSEETELLRSLYGEHYVQIGGHAKLSSRQKRLADLIAADNPRKPKRSDWELQALDLIKRDESEDDLRWGQRLRDVFPLSDVIIDATDQKSIIKSLDRFFRSLFGDQRVTPTPDEYGMQLARTAALRSSDLSRQVGASIMNGRQELQALGCNEVPKAGGGTYWEGSLGDAREFQLGKDSNEERKQEVLDDLLGRLIDAGVIVEKFSDHNCLKAALKEGHWPSIKDSQLMDSLEYGRTVHAEMNAITDAARSGRAIRDCILYCNTFPCHNCAKHIVAAGISRVIYLIPFPKSYAEDLFPDSIVIEPDCGDHGKVVFEQFVGVLGPMFGRVFEKSKWKAADGSVPSFDKRSATFIRRSPEPAYGASEVIVVEEMVGALTSAGLKITSPEN